MKCPRCDVDMDIGIAIDAGPSNTRIFVGSKSITRPHEVLIDVYKCPKCGHSDDGVNPNKLMAIIDNTQP